MSVTFGLPAENATLPDATDPTYSLQILTDGSGPDLELKLDPPHKETPETGAPPVATDKLNLITVKLRR